MESKIRRLIPVVCMLGFAAQAGCSGDAASEPDGVLGMREGGQGTTFTANRLEGLCTMAMACAPADAPGLTVGSCVDTLGAFFDDLFDGAPPACQAAFDAMLDCMATSAECVDGELNADACMAESEVGAATCEGWEPNIDVGDYIDVQPVEVTDQTNNSG